MKLAKFSDFLFSCYIICNFCDNPDVREYIYEIVNKSGVDIEIIGYSGKLTKTIILAT